MFKVVTSCCSSFEQPKKVAVTKVENRNPIDMEIQQFLFKIFFIFNSLI
ncbi:hypothetical protein NMS_0146 [Nonlabens marinus S1-08]|uniref:Uncharacterized protein n=1 Tax=Nonlabens marinus S1-08 TaxID=1454201 RepID=W8VNY3_9FLAO|nr:hypothetical protein NMS_0146 [Nonlabens marinus S1-08]